jgi:hypothetical protein
MIFRPTMSLKFALAGCTLLASVDLLYGHALRDRARGSVASLGGRVVRGDITGKVPVGRIVVSIRPGDEEAERRTVTDDQGRFAFDNLPQGRYLVRASRVGWVTTYYGSPRPGRPPGVRVEVAEGAQVSLEVPVIPGSVIAGQVVDQNGRPMPREYPSLLESRLVGSRRVLTGLRDSPIGSFERSTDEQGNFRLFGLPPGTYYLVVNPSAPAGARLTTEEEVRWAFQPPGGVTSQTPALGPVSGYAPVYFPGTLDPTASQPIHLGPGEVREGLTYRVGLVVVARLEGVARRADGEPAAGARISLSPRQSLVITETSSREVTADATGRFAFQNVPPGEYRVIGRLAGAAQRCTAHLTGQAVLQWAQTDVSVSGVDVSSVALTLAAAPAVSGRLTFAGTTMKPPADLTTIRLQFISMEAAASAMAMAAASIPSYSAAVDATGAFRADGLPPDSYAASVTWPGMRTGDGLTGWWLTTIAVGGRDIGDSPIEVRPNEDLKDVTIAFKDRIGAIEGRLTDGGGRPAPEYFVLSFPVERSAWTMTSRRAAPAVRPGTDGQFRIPGLPPGQYYLAVVTAVDPDEVMDPAFLEAILPGAVRVTVSDGATVRQDLRIAIK